MTIEIEKKIRLKTPNMPSFLYYEDNDDMCIDVGDLNKEQMEIVADSMAQAFIDHVMYRKRDK